MKKAQQLGKSITYKLGYSNFAFDLWIVLHKAECNRSFDNRHQYVDPINRAYHEQFSSMDEYKKEDNFKRLLGKLSLANVLEAIVRAEKITQRNRENKNPIRQYCGYEFYTVNPSLSVWERVKHILCECGVLRVAC